MIYFRKMDSEAVNRSVQALKDEMSNIQREMDDLQSDWNELQLWVQNGVDMNEVNARNTELTLKQDVLSQRFADVRMQLAALLDHV